MVPVCVFAKAPVPGMVKTRLIPRLGRQGAAELASAMLVDVWNAALASPGSKPILATVDMGCFPVAVDPDNIWLQGGGDLGTRLERILSRALAETSAAIAVGADSPLLTANHFEAAVKALRSHDAVIGRSLDGGFYLLGLRACSAGQFCGVPWSTAMAGETTVRCLKDKRQSVFELPLLLDVDTPEDFYMLLHQLRKDLLAAPATRQWCLSNGFLEEPVTCGSVLSFPR